MKCKKCGGKMKKEAESDGVVLYTCVKCGWSEIKR